MARVLHTRGFSREKNTRALNPEFVSSSFPFLYIAYSVGSIIAAELIVFARITTWRILCIKKYEKFKNLFFETP